MNGPCNRVCSLKNEYGYCQITACINPYGLRYDDGYNTGFASINCTVCEMLEKGDTLYQHTSDDIGDIYSAIRDVQFCPKCGRKLYTYQERMNERRMKNGR